MRRTLRARGPLPPHGAPVRSLLALAAALLLCAPPRAIAGGFDLAWDRCWPGGGTSARESACDTDAGSQTLVGSFVLPADQPRFVGIEVKLSIEAEGASLPDWWSFFNGDACRAAALSASFDFMAFDQGSCTDPWSGQAFGGIAAYHTAHTQPPVPDGRANEGELVLAAAMANPVALHAGTEYYAFRLTISNAGTVGGCGGCATPVCVSLVQIRSGEAGGSYQTLTRGLSNDRVGWQHGASCEPVVQNRTWGQVKTLYRR